MTALDLEDEGRKFRSLQKQLEESTRKKEKLLTQLNENQLVSQELEAVDASAQVFKLVGPVLIAQETSEARSNVRKRIEFINSELKKTEADTTELEGKTLSGLVPRKIFHLDKEREKL
ncbi:prefoldin beta subunit [Pelomyxa schiedti]|nr:prefoldin beta subunit [Pelomyxa schiedti]